MVANTGWTWDEALDGLTLPRYQALREQWRAHPPVHWLVAAALGVKPADANAPRRPTLEELKAALPQGRL
ncbi:MAG: hypothetical protein ACLPN5_08370 [Roseiarcus sp.]